MIDDPQAIKFVNEVIRPMAESARAIVARVEDAKTAWFGGLNQMFPNDSTAVDDGREAEGISRLTGQDINSVMSVLIAMDDQINAEIIAKPCVRPLEAS